MRTACAGVLMVTCLPRMSDASSSNPGTTIGCTLLLSSNKSKTRVHCFPPPDSTYEKLTGKIWLSHLLVCGWNRGIKWYFRVFSLKVEHFRPLRRENQLRTACAGVLMVTRLPRMSDASSSNPSTTIGCTLLLSSNKSKTRVHCFPPPDVNSPG
ncbi:hypothetical protein T265_07558 [Opisthorchis viverrini]|uniref:Secreted protein n=1 Tax=Opisthorchis viverrini TaxID=6198 RepID=A0A075AB82_OPIVI|nr:hypothetical protein T265_07558 [Opisthorchis viverrini]KER24884.1 hypothetical protein T265_07558 [Opisthorchis viverrini]